MKLINGVNMKTAIKKISALEILDSRGNPTVEATVILEDGCTGVASVPSGASVGIFEAHELRDKGIRFGGRGVLQAVSLIEGEINSALAGKNAACQAEIDNLLLKLDGTKNKTRLGSNSILAVSLATARAAANSQGLPLYKYLSKSEKFTLPCPMMNIMNGGAHAANNLEIQEFMIAPVGIQSFSEQLRAGAEIYKALGKILKERGYSTSVGDEGGFAPNLSSDEEALELIGEAIIKAGYTYSQVKMALDVAASGWYSNASYTLAKSGKHLSAEELISYYSALIENYPIFSIEDGLGEEDYEGWRKLTDKLSSNVLLVGDDLFVTNKSRLLMGIDMKIANAILIKPNQIGSLSETVGVIGMARDNGYASITSHRSGDTEDSFIADLAVAMGTKYIKSGAPCRSERLAKYNRLLKIEKELSDN